MTFFLESGVSMALLVVVMLLCLELGQRLGRRHRRDDADGADKGTGAIEGAVFALMGLLIAFTFSGALTRFDARRDLILKESNAMSAAWLRLELLPAPEQAALRADFRTYLDRRLAETRDAASLPAPDLLALQQKIWARAVAATRQTQDGSTPSLLLPALNDMFGVASARYQAVRTHPPTIVYVLLLVLALLCSLLAGYGMAGKKRSWLHIGCFVGSLLLAIYVILDVEFPRRGLIRVDAFDQALLELQTAWK